MNLLDIINSLKLLGFVKPKVIDMKHVILDWTIEDYDKRVLSINQSLQIELEDGTEHNINKGNYLNFGFISLSVFP